MYDFIKEDYDPLMQEVIPRKYFSGGTVGYKEGGFAVLTGDPSQQSLEVKDAIAKPDTLVTWVGVENADEAMLIPTEEEIEVINVSST